MLNRPAAFLIVALFFTAAFICLFLGRAADDNSLFSWSWVFIGIDASRLYLLFTAGLVLAFFLAPFAVPDRYQASFLFLFSFAATIPLWGEPELIVDASRYFTQAKHLEMYGFGYFFKEWGSAIQAWTDLPLVPFSYGIIFKLFGETRAAVQFFTTGLFAGTVVLTFLIGKTLWDRETGFVAGLLLLGIPYLLAQVPLLLVDVPTMFFLSLSLFTFLHALDRGGAAPMAFSALAIVCTALSKYSAWFMLTVLVVALIVAVPHRGGTERPQRVRRGIGVLLAAAALSGAILFLKFEVVSRQIGLLATYQKAGLDRWGESFYSTFFFQVHPFITAAALLSLVVAFRARDLKYVIVLWLILLAVFFNITRIRYLLPLFPLLTLMAGYGLTVIERKDLRRFVVYGVVVSSLVIVYFAYVPFAESMSMANLKRAGEFLNGLKAEKMEVFTLSQQDFAANPAVAVPLLDLYTGKTIRYHYQPENFPPRAERESSSLRFTWEYQNPMYYTLPDVVAVEPVLVVLSDPADISLPPALGRRLRGYRLSASFCRSECIFRYGVGVRVFQKKPIASFR